MLVIAPEECIDCGLCVPERPIDAIFDEDLLPQKPTPFIGLNAQYALEWPVITTMDTPPMDAAQWEEVPDKYPEHFDPSPARTEHD